MSQASAQGLLAGKRFFIDPKIDKATSIKVKQKLIALGGKVEDFLDKGIHFALTSETYVDGKRKMRGAKAKSPLQSPFSATSPSVEQSCSTGHRYEGLAKQARNKIHSTNMVDIAKSFGIKIRPIDDVLTWLNKKTEHLNNAKTSDSDVLKPPIQPNDIKLKDPCIKVEDLDRSFKPIYEEFESFVFLDLSVPGNKCPIVSNETKYKSKSFPKKSKEKKGFCECCQCSYINDRKHRKTADHIEFGQADSHFEYLDQYINKHDLDVDKFLKRIVSSETESCSNRISGAKATCSSNTVMNGPALSSTVAVKLLKLDPRISEDVTVNANTSQPRRRSPRKFPKAESASSTPTAARTSIDEISSRKSDSKPATHAASRLADEPDNSTNQRDGTKKREDAACSVFTSPVAVTPSSKRTRSSSVSVDASAKSPATRLRSYKRKREELDGKCGNSPDVVCRRTRRRVFSNNSLEIVSSKDDALQLLRSSRDNADESEFLGF